MRIAVTGGAGFIGSALVRRLVAEEHEVRVLDNFTRGKESSVPDNVFTVTGDIRNLEIVLRAIEGCEEVIHLAYINGTKLFYEMPDRVLDVAVRGMINLLQACKRCEVKRMMLLSSSEVCRAEVGNMSEQVPLVIPDPFNPRYSYSAGKIISEMLAIHSRLFDWLTIIRPFNIYGPNMHEGHVIPDFTRQLRDKIIELHTPPNYTMSPFEILGDGEETRSFCYIDDFIDGLMCVHDRGQHMGIYNIGTEEEVTIRFLAHKIASLQGLELAHVVEGKQLREGSITRRRPDISKIRELGFDPRISLEEGLKKMVNPHWTKVVALV